MEEETFTPEEVAQQISAMRDSVWVIDDTVDNNETITEELVQRLNANIGHLELMMGKDYIMNSGDDLSDITAAIAKGKAALPE